MVFARQGSGWNACSRGKFLQVKGNVWRCNSNIKVKVKWSRYRPGVAQRVGRGIALLFHDRGTRRGWVVSSTPRQHFTPGKDPEPILQETGWASGPVWTGGRSRSHRNSIPDRPARSSVAIPTELPGPHIIGNVVFKLKKFQTFQVVSNTGCWLDYWYYCQLSHVRRWAAFSLTLVRSVADIQGIKCSVITKMCTFS